MGEVIVITSGKGGVGKTTSTANIGYQLAKRGRRVLTVDTDTGLRNLDVALGLENRVIYNLVDVLEGNCSISEAIIADHRTRGLFMLPTAQLKGKDEVSAEQVSSLLSYVKPSYDYIILDCPAGIEQGFKSAISGADRAVVVTTSDISSIRDVDRVIGLLKVMGLSNIGLIVNRVRPELVSQGLMMGTSEINELLPVELLGSVPEDEYITIASSKGMVIAPEDTISGKAYDHIADVISHYLYGNGGMRDKLFRLYNRV